MSRRSTPDILGALMGDAVKPESQPATKPESNKEVKPEVHLAVKEASVTAVKQVKAEAVPHQPLFSEEEGLEGPKEKATFNLPTKLLSTLEDRWMEIRKSSGSKQISKTLMVEVALEMAFSEFELKKQQGKFYSKLVNSKAVKQ